MVGGGDGGGSEAVGLAASRSYPIGCWNLQQVAEVIDPAGSTNFATGDEVIDPVSPIEGVH